MSITVRLARLPGLILADGSLGPGCRVAPTVTDSMLPSERAALLRAEAELDRLGVQRVPITGAIPAPGHLETGTVGLLIDGERGPTPAKLTGITYSLSLSDDGRSVTADATLNLERLDA
jgi:hypothetical protein